MENALPKYIFDCVEDITVDELKKMGVRGVGIDLDNTTVHDAGYTAKKEILGWFENTLAAGIKIVIITNTYHARALYFSKKFKVPYYALANKPSPKKLIKAAKRYNIPIENFAMIGDQLFTDVLCANNCGAVSVWVRPFMREKMFAKKFAKRRAKEKELCEKYGIEYKEIRE